MTGPKLSLFTPTHDPQYLDEAYDSLLVQDYDHWEWVLIPNGDMKTVIPKNIVDDPRVRIGQDPKTDKIGALKLHACKQCLGDAFIEFDHDDMLVPGTLKLIAEKISEGAGFVYSDVAVFNDGSLTSWAYHPTHGWENYDIRVYDKPFKATRCFDPTPRCLCEVYYAPDHVRCWSRKTYFKAGGHDPELSVGDDHDLVCRTYLTGDPFVYLGGCHYLYRYHPDNTVKSRGRLIQEQTRKNKYRYLHKLIEEWCRQEKHQRIILLEEMQAGRWNPSRPLSLPANTFGQIVAFDVIQFIPPALQVDFFNQAYDALIPGGYLSIAVPSDNGRYGIQDPRFLTKFNPNSFLYYTDKTFAQNNPDIRCRFQQVHIREYHPSEDFEKHQMIVMETDLCALKGQRQPGVCKI